MMEIQPPPVPPPKGKPVSREGTMVLIPTELERDRLNALGGFDDLAGHVELCGFGPVGAAARTAALVATRPEVERILLVGLGGTYDLKVAPVGSAVQFGGMMQHGVGVLPRKKWNFLDQPPLTPKKLGFPQAWDDVGDPIYDHVTLFTPRWGNDGEPTLLTVCSASADMKQANERRRWFPDVTVEDMEGFGCHVGARSGEHARGRRLEGGFRVVRGICNIAGDRNKANWKIAEALQAAHVKARIILAQPIWH